MPDGPPCIWPYSALCYYYALLVCIVQYYLDRQQHEIAFLVADNTYAPSSLSNLTRHPQSSIDMAPRLEIRPAKLLKATPHVVPGELLLGSYVMYCIVPD